MKLTLFNRPSFAGKFDLAASSAGLTFIVSVLIVLPAPW